MAIRNALEKAPFTLHGLAKKSGVDYETLRQWAAGRRNPRPANVERILSALDAQADEIKALVEEARRAAPPQPKS